jgi:hypothetical protein
MPSKAGQKARTLPKRQVEIALKWMRDEIGMGEASAQMNIHSITNTVYRMGIALRQAYRQGLLKQVSRPNTSKSS